MECCQELFSTITKGISQRINNFAYHRLLARGTTASLGGERGQSDGACFALSPSLPMTTDERTDQITSRSSSLAPVKAPLGEEPLPAHLSFS